VPEISLTPQTVERFTGRFGKNVSFTHSKMTDEERFDQWKKAREGEISIMIGPRSAIFTPFNKLGVIIIDEEHENSYKSDTTPKYSARETAIKLKEITGCQVVLGSATPSIESYYNAEIGNYELITLENRVNMSFPKVYVTDMRQELANGNRSIFSKPLFDAIEENLKNGKQTILFLNRRGHSTFVSCRKCGYVMTCEDCNVSYTYHLHSNKLVCHYCSKTVDNPDKCPQCGLPYIKYFGVGTQKVEEAAKKYFPTARILRMDLDTTGKKHSHENILNEFKKGNADILIGTQMIAKGLDFPNVTLVGVVAADLTLNIGDFRCGEVSFQLLTQVSGRAGRANDEGKVFIQSYQPEHYSIELAAKNDYVSFYKKEIEIRRIQMYPPFSHIFFVMFSGENEKFLIDSLNMLMDIFKTYNARTNFDLLGPAPAVISKIKKQYRWKVIVKGIEEERVRNFVLYCMDRLREKVDLSSVTVNMTLDPTFIQ
ncbi:MAG: primosomal protein N', partial [Firmicutes bacterium]|nr:primosomal protein N' [Bacillota bacterium]